jgi:hypothetical protein
MSEKEILTHLFQIENLSSKEKSLKGAVNKNLYNYNKFLLSILSQKKFLKIKIVLNIN